MTFTFRPAVRENVSLLIGLAGGTGSGKTMSALLLARGLAGGKPFAVIDTENGRALHYADLFDFHHGELHAPFRPERYADAIQEADKADYPVVVVDSASHEHAGDGGLLDWHEEEFQRLGGRDAVKMTAWIKPKMAHKAMVSRLLQVKAHVILCFRAEEKIEITKDKDGKTVIRPKQSLVGLDGWLPIAEKTLPYELTASFLLVADKPGIPRPIKLQEQHRPFFPLDKPISEAAGTELAKWAAGGKSKAAAKTEANAEPEPDDTTDTLADELLEVCALLETVDLTKVRELIAQHNGDAAWFARQIATARENLATQTEQQESIFAAQAEKAQAKGRKRVEA